MIALSMQRGVGKSDNRNLHVILTESYHSHIQLVGDFVDSKYISH